MKTMTLTNFLSRSAVQSGSSAPTQIAMMGSQAVSSSFDVEDVLSNLTVSEKIALLSGVDSWHTAPVHRLGVPSIRLSDGPNGVRGTRYWNSVRAACLPCGNVIPILFMGDVEDRRELADYSHRNRAGCYVGH